MFWIDRGIFVCLCGLVLVLPFTIAGAHIFSSGACLAFLAGKGLEFKRDGRISTRVPASVIIPLVLFLSVCALSIFWSQAPAASLRAFFGKVLAVVVLLFAVVETMITLRRFVVLAGLLFFSGYILCLDGFWQFLTGADIFRSVPLVDARMSGPMRHPNDLGAYLIIIVSASLPSALWIWGRKNVNEWTQRWKVRLGLCLFLIVSGTALGLTYSRSAWLGVLVAIGVFVFIRRQFAAVCAGIVLFFAMVFSPLMTSARHVSFISDAVVPIGQPVGPSSAGEFTGSDRLNLWKDACKIIKDHPVMGTGLNTYAFIIPKYSRHRQLYPHNSYLQMWAELGIVGLGIFIWLLWSVGRFVMPRLFAARKGGLTFLITGFFAGWIGLLVESGLDTTFYSVQLSRLLWLVMGLLLAGVLFLEKESPGASSKV